MAKKGRNLNKVVWASQTSGPLPRQVVKVGRNDPCPCGSGQKYKACHEKDGDAFLEKLAREEEKARLAASGRPWWKRLLGLR